MKQELLKSFQRKIDIQRERAEKKKNDRCAVDEILESAKNKLRYDGFFSLCDYKLDNEKGAKSKETLKRVNDIDKLFQNIICQAEEMFKYLIPHYSSYPTKRLAWVDHLSKRAGLSYSEENSFTFPFIITVLYSVNKFISSSDIYKLTQIIFRKKLIEISFKVFKDLDKYPYEKTYIYVAGEFLRIAPYLRLGFRTYDLIDGVARLYYYSKSNNINISSADELSKHLVVDL